MKLNFLYWIVPAIACSIFNKAYAIDCNPLKPNVGVNRSVEDYFKGRAEIVKKLGSGEIQNYYRDIEENTLKQFPNADQLHIWNSTIYMLCTMLESSKLDEEKKFEQFQWLITTWRQGPPTPSIPIDSKVDYGNSFHFSASDYKPGDLVPSPHISNGAIIDERGLTSQSDKASAIVKFRGFKLNCPCEIEISMSRCKGCEIELYNGSKKICSLQTGAYGTHGNTVVFEGEVEKGVSDKGSKHTFKINAEGIRYFLNGKFVGFKNYKLQNIDEIVIRGFKKEHPYIGRSYLYSVSGKPL